ncbi:Uncharacterised protein [Acinetobacter baumannii]|nr:Uncharacterised protein [Acinetobacter baumannii]
MNHPQRRRFAQALFAECRQQPARRAIAEQFGERLQGLFVGLPQSVEGKAQHQPRRSRQAQRQRFAGEGQQRRRRRTRAWRAPRQVGAGTLRQPLQLVQCLRPLQP